MSFARPMNSPPSGPIRSSSRPPSAPRAPASGGSATRAGATRCWQQLQQHDAFAEGLLVQAAVTGSLERTQAVFDRGRLVASHIYRQVVEGPGGGDVLKISVVNAAGARDRRADRAGARLARRAVVRLHPRGRNRHAVFHRRQSASGRADECVAERRRPARRLAADFAGRDAAGAARRPRGRRSPGSA